MYNENGELEFWLKHYYKNGKLVKYEEKNGNWRTYEYDAFGNQIKLSFELGDYEYEYDNMHNLVKMEYFESGILINYTVYEYSENQRVHSYKINSINDTSNWSNYYYLDGNLSHIESNNDDTYFYYSIEVDSVISTRKNNTIFQKNILNI